MLCLVRQHHASDELWVNLAQWVVGNASLTFGLMNTFPRHQTPPISCSETMSPISPGQKHPNRTHTERRKTAKDIWKRGTGEVREVITYSSWLFITLNIEYQGSRCPVNLCPVPRHFTRVCGTMFITEHRCTSFYFLLKYHHNLCLAAVAKRSGSICSPAWMPNPEPSACAHTYTPTSSFPSIGDEVQDHT